MNLTELSGIRPFYLAESASTFQYSGKVVSESLPEEIKRVEKKQLEAAYLRDPLLFNGINLIVKTFLCTGFKITHPNKTAQAYLDGFIEGTNLLTKTIFAVQDFCVYGDAFQEILYSKDKKHIVGVDRIDAKSMDISKDMQGKPALDAYGRPKFYFQEIPMHLKVERELVANPLNSSHRGIMFELNKIVHFKLFSVGDSLNGIGLVEPLYATSLQKLQMQKSYANVIYSAGFPKFVVYHGDENHEPTEVRMQKTENQLQNVNSLTAFAYPYYDKIELLSPKNIEKIGQYLDYFREEEIIGLGIPEPLVTGKAKDVSMAALRAMSTQFERTIKLIQKSLTDSWNEQLFRPMAKLEGWKTLPEVVWPALDVEDLDAKSERLKKYIDAQILIPTPALASYISKIENLPSK